MLLLLTESSCSDFRVEPHAVSEVAPTPADAVAELSPASAVDWWSADHRSCLQKTVARQRKLLTEAGLTMPSVDFQKYCRDLAIISDTVTISSKGNVFTMSASGDFAEQEIIIGETTNGLVISKKEAEVSCRFPLKYLNLFCKSSGLCSNIEIYLKARYPLILIFNCASLGSLSYGLAPKTESD